jgi:trans-aconitate 2-methyltransferase
MKAYTWDAQDYATHSAAQQTWARELIGKLHLQGHEEVLDIGSGDGKVTAEIAEHVPHGRVVGVDNSPAMIKAARDKYGDYANLSFQLLDARALPFEEAFDVVFSSASLHWVRNHRPVLESIYKSLRLGGRSLLQMGGRGNGAAIFSVLNDMIKEAPWRPYFHGFEFPYGFHDAREYRMWLEEVGLEPIRVELIPKDMTHEKTSRFAGWIRTTWLPYTQRIAEDKREAFVGELVNRYIEKYPPDADGNIHVQMVRLEVEALKDP